LLSASTAGDVTVFFYSEKKVTKKTPLRGFAPKNPLEGVAVRLASAYFFCTASIVLSEGAAPRDPEVWDSRAERLVGVQLYTS